MCLSELLQSCRDTARPGRADSTRRDQRRSKDRAFNPMDWQGNSADSASTSSQPRQQQPDVSTAAPSNSSASTTGSRRDTAREADLQFKAGFDDWEPTGAGRKGWYNPQSSSSSTVDSGGAEFPADPLPPPKAKAGPSGSGQAPEVPQRASTGELVPAENVDATPLLSVRSKHVYSCLYKHPRPSVTGLRRHHARDLNISMKIYSSCTQVH